MIDTGLWRYTRHPNYFGESLLWYGYYLINCGGSVGPAGGYYTFYSPLLMHYMLRFGTGALILEAKQRRKPAFRVYMLETNQFVPWCYKKIEGKEREDLMAKFKIEIAEEAKANKGDIMWGIWKNQWRKYLYKGGLTDEDQQKQNGTQPFENVPVDTEKDKTDVNTLELQKVADENTVQANVLNVQ